MLLTSEEQSEEVETKNEDTSISKPMKDVLISSETEPMESSSSPPPLPKEEPKIDMSIKKVMDKALSIVPK